MPPWNVAILGLGSTGRAFAAAVDGDARFQLAAVADTDAERLRRFGERPAVRCFEDYRTLIIEMGHAGLDALLVALAPSQSTDFVLLAAERGIFVLHAPPPARGVDEARQIARMFNHGRASMLVAGLWSPLSSLATEEEIAAWLGEIRAAYVLVATNVTADGWRGDLARAGGGVLLHGAYEAVAWLVDAFGIPASVYAVSAMALETGAPRRYDTEDIAMVTLHFEGGRLAHVTAVRGMPQLTWRATIVGTRASAELSRNGLALQDAADAAADGPINAADNAIARSLGRLAVAIRAATPKATGRIDDHIAVLSVIEAAYLSARTGVPESPDRFLE